MEKPYLANCKASLITLVILHWRSQVNEVADQHRYEKSIKHSSWWRRLEDVLKTSFLFIFNRRLENVFKTFWSSWFFSTLNTLLQNVVKTFLRRFLNVFKSSCKYILKTSCRCLQAVFKTYTEGFVNMSSRHLRDIFKTSWMHFQDVFKTSLIHL